MRFRRCPTRALVLALPWLLLLGSALPAGPAPPLPAELPAAERSRLQQITEQASVATQADGEPFVTRRGVFEYLLDHPEFATHVTQALKLARYRIWQGREGLWLDDGWGATGHFAVVYAAGGTRVMYARGQYKHWPMPAINGQAVIVIAYRVEPTTDDRSLIRATVTGFVKLDSRLLELLGWVLGPVAAAKADKEARLLVRVFARASRAIDSDPAGVAELLRQRPDVPPREFEEFRKLLELR